MRGQSDLDEEVKLRYREKRESVGMWRCVRDSLRKKTNLRLSPRCSHALYISGDARRFVYQALASKEINKCRGAALVEIYNIQSRMLFVVFKFDGNKKTADRSLWSHKSK